MINKKAKIKVGMHDVYTHSIEKIEKTLSKSNTRIRTVSARNFNRIVKAYLRLMYRRLLEGWTWYLPNGLGELHLYKIKPTRYNPTARVVRTENGKKVSKKITYDLKDGFWYFYFWNCSKKYRVYKFVANRKWKAEMMKRVEQGMDYLDYTETDRLDFIYLPKKKRKPKIKI